MRTGLIAAMMGVALLAGCGSSSSGDQSTATGQPKAPKSYRQQVVACIHGLLMDTRKAGNATRVESPGGRLVANIQFFPSAAEAHHFADRLIVDGDAGGKAVAVWLNGAGSDDRATVRDCLTP